MAVNSELQLAKRINSLIEQQDLPLVKVAKDGTGKVIGLIGSSTAQELLVISSSAPNNNDGRADGTIYIQTV